jgi:uncharacterized protein YodC (DUF2158 family)
MSNNFKIGDTVRLKCGGVLMVVQNLRGDAHVECVWHDGAAPCREIYAAEILSLVVSTGGARVVE